MIDGTTQSGWKANDLSTGDDAVLPIVLDGTRAGASVDGLTIAGGNSTIRGLVFSNFSGNGITLSSASNLVAGDEVGTDATGETAAGNGRGIFVTAAPDNTIGGTVASDRNLISGNQTVGLGLDGAATLRTVAEGNVIGTDASARSALPNAQGGIEVSLGASASTIGGTVEGAGNVVAGNDGFGVAILAGDSTGATTSNLLFENLIYANSGTQIEVTAVSAPTPTITGASIYPSSTLIHGNLPISYDQDRIEFFTTSDTVARPPVYLGEAEGAPVGPYSRMSTIISVTAVTFQFYPTAGYSPGQTVVSTATFDLNQANMATPGQNTSGFSAPATIQDEPQADLALTTSASASQVHPGQSFTETFTVSNLGPDDASDAMLSVMLPVDTQSATYYLSSAPADFDVPSIDKAVSYSPMQGVVFADGSYHYYSETKGVVFPRVILIWVSSPRPVTI